MGFIVRIQFLQRDSNEIVTITVVCLLILVVYYTAFIRKLITQLAVPIRKML